MTGWAAFAFIVGSFAAFIAWGCWCQRQMNRREARAGAERKAADVRAALVYRDAMWDDQGHLAMWEREMENER